MTETEGAPKTRLAGWTLVEVLVALTILLVLGGLMLGLFTGAWAGWHGTGRSAGWTTRAADWIAQFDADVSGARIDGDMGLTGDAGRLRLLRPALRPHPALLLVEYAWDGRQRVSRSETEWYWPADARHRNADAVVTEQLFATFAFAYGTRGDDGHVVWQPRWFNPTNAPDAVRVQLSAPDTGTAITHVVPLPPGPVFPPAQTPEARTD